MCLLASITKPIVATAVLQQVEAGRVELAGNLGTWAPELVNPDWAPVTPWHVLSHTSGIDDVDLEAVMRGGGGRADLLDRLSRAGQVTRPGTTYHYASVPYDLLAEAVARRTGEPFETLLRRTLLDPLGMSSTTFDPRPDPALGPRMAPIVVGGLEGHPIDRTRRSSARTPTSTCVAAGCGARPRTCSGSGARCSAAASSTASASSPRRWSR